MGNLEIDQNLDFQRVEWKIERIGWVVMALILLAALLGLFGAEGPLSDSVAGQQEGPFWVHYNRFGHMIANSGFNIYIDPSQLNTGSQVRLSMEGDFRAAYQVRAVNPQPSQVISAGRNQLIYVFNVQPSASPVKIDFFVESRRMGLQNIQIGVEGGPSVHYWQFLYP